MASQDDSFAALFEQTASTKALRRRVHPGDSLEVVVVAVGRDAVFADLGGKQEGVFERVDLTDDDGKLHVEVGSRVTAVVDSLDATTGQARLRPIAVRGEGAATSTAVRPPATPGAPAIVEGARVKGQVTGIERYGVFVQVTGTHGRSGRGLVPAPETATPRGADLKKHFTIGQEVEAKVLQIDETGRIRLSIAALGLDDEHRSFEAYKAGQTTPSGENNASAPSKAPRSPGGAGASSAPVRSFGTLADLLPKGVRAAAPPAPAKPERPAARPPARDKVTTPSSRSRPSRGR